MVGKPQWSAGLVYVDLLAGPGICQIRDNGKRLPGSALIAAHASKQFAKIICVELDPQNAEACRERLALTPSAAQAEVLVGDCNALIDDVSCRIPRRALTLAFIDPPGFDIQFSTLARLSQNRQVDYLLLFADAIDLIRNFDEYAANEGSKLDRFFGTQSKWRELLRASDAKSGHSLSEAVRKLFERQMKEQLGYGGFDYKTIKGPHGKLYDLVYTSKHARGLEFWKKISLTDQGGQGEFNWRED